MARALTSSRPRSRAGRLPYAFVGVVVLAALVLLTSYFEVAVNWSSGNESYNIAEETESAIQLANAEISAAAYQDLMRSEAAILAAGANPALNELNVSLEQNFSGVDGSLAQLGLFDGSFVDGTVVVTALAWGINVTWDEGQVYEGVSQVALTSDANDPYLPLAQIPDASHPYAPGETEAPVYPMAIGWVLLSAFDAPTGVSSVQKVSFTQTVPSEIGFLQDSAEQFSAASSGPQGDFSQLVEYLVTTLGQLRALAGYGSGGYPGPQAGTNISQTHCVSSTVGMSILNCNDINDSVNLAEILMSLQYFHNYDPDAANAFVASLPPGAYQTLIQTYVSTGTVDGAALYLLLLQQNGGWFDNTIATGEGLAAAVDSFADRYTYDLLDQFFGNQTVDPTLTDPVVSWCIINGPTYPGCATAGYPGLNLANLSALLNKWMNSYQNWLGITIDSLPGSDVTAYIAWENETVNGCTYTILPGAQIQVSTNPVPNIADLIMGTSYPPDTNNGVTSVPLPSLLYNVWENATVDQARLNGDFWTEASVGGTEQAGYYFTDESLLHEYDQSGGCGASGCTGTALTPYQDAVDAIINTVTSAMEYKPDPASPTQAFPITDVNHTGYLNYLADNATKDGNNYTAVQAGLPDLTTAAGIDQVLNSSAYSLLTNGSSAILQGPYELALQKFATEATNSSWLNTSFIDGALHPYLLGANASGPGIGVGASEGTYPYALSDIAGLTVREWFQLLYGLYFGTASSIPTSIPSWATIGYSGMDASSYHVQSQGVEHDPPAVYQEPDFATNVMNETYVSIMDWMGWDGTGTGFNAPDECDNGQRNPTFGYCGYTGAAYNANYDNVLTTGSGGVCAAADPANPAITNGQAAYQLAAKYWYNDEGSGTGPTIWDHTWNNVRNATLNALDATVSVPTVDTVVEPGIDTVHNAITSSWLSVKNDTGNGYFNSQNFSDWAIRTFAAPIINDTRMLGQVGGWLSQLFQSTDQAIWNGANATSIVSKPYVEDQVPYEFFQGNYSQQGANEQLFNESLQPLASGLTITGDGGFAINFHQPTETIHLVDPQDDASNMGISPFSSTWTVTLDGSLSLQLRSSQASLYTDGFLNTTNANYTIPMDLSLPVTLYTPWPISYAWNPTEAPAPGDTDNLADPTGVQTRGLLGLTGHDYHTAVGGTVALSHSTDFMPGVYVSPALDQFFDQSVSIGKVLSAGTLESADLLAALPDRGVGASAAWAQNLTLLENVTNTALTATATSGYDTAVQTTLAELNYNLTQAYLPHAFNDVTFAEPGYFGAAATLDTATQSFNTYSSTNEPTNCQAAPSAGSCYGDPLQIDMDFAVGAPQVSASYDIDNDFNVLHPAMQGFQGTWSSSGGFQLGAYWQDFQTPYTLSITGAPGGAQAEPLSVPSNYAQLQVPAWSSTGAYPAVLSVDGVGALPSAAQQAFNASVAGYLPSPGVFANYVAQQQYEAGLLYDAWQTPAPSTGVTQFGYGTNVLVSTAPGAAREESFLVAMQDAGVPGGIFNSPGSQLQAFLLWYVANHEALAYGLGEASIDPTTLASAEPFLLHSIYRNMTLATGDPTSPSTFAYLSDNLAASEADLGGTGGGLLCSPTILLGGGTPGTWGMSGSLTT